MEVVEASVTRAIGADGSRWARTAACNRLALHLLNAVVSVGPGDRMGTTGFGASKDVVARGLN
jgi:hypothetical protein